MKISKLLQFGLILVFVISFFSCDNDDDDVSDPSGTIVVNIMNEGNGETKLGNSDVYIDKANNFYSPYSCLIANFGHKNGLGSLSVPVLNGLSDRVAVEPGYAYQIFKKNAIQEFPSGKFALNIMADYYNVYVVSQIKENNAIVGANVKYVLMNVPDQSLPEYNSLIGIIDHNDNESWELTIKLPVSDFEYKPVFANSSYYTLEHEQVGKELKVRLIDFRSSDVFGFYIRIQNSYTYIYGTVK